MRYLRKFVRIIEKVSLYSGKVVAFWTVIAVAIITFEVTMRYLFNRPTNWGHEAMTLIFGMQYVLCGAYAHYTRSHVRVDILYAYWPRRAQAWVDLLTSGFFFLFAGVLTYTGWFFYWESQKIWEVSFTDWAPPYYPVKFAVFLGALLLLLQGVAWFIRDLCVAVTGRELR